MIKTTSSQYPEEHTLYSSKSKCNILITVTCPICDAGYTPSPEHQNLLQAPPVALESAFMRMCHFCFRCRRPACPACWDNIHGACGACVQEAGLPFRAEAASLKGVVFPPIRQEQSAQEDISSPQLVCIRPGRFHNDVVVETDPVKAVPVASLKKQLLAVETAEEPETIVQVPTGTPKVEKHDEDKRMKPLVRFMKVVERIVTIILLVVLLAIVGLIILAEVSVLANAQIVRLLHVDIRHEVAYLLYLVRQIHW